MGVEKADSNQKEHFKDRCIGFGTGNSKKEGEQAAAKMALISYGVLKEDQYIKADLYYPPWNLLANYDGETPVLTKNKEEDVDDNVSVYSKMSEKSITL
jgi:hypothetical protein